MFFAEKGAGAWMNDTRIRVSGRHRMIESIFATGVPFGGRADLPLTLQDLARLMPACAGVRRWGSAALDMAYVAVSRYEGFWERRLNPWDLAAGIIIVKEAGRPGRSDRPGGRHHRQRFRRLLERADLRELRQGDPRLNRPEKMRF